MMAIVIVAVMTLAYAMPMAFAYEGDTHADNDAEKSTFTGTADNSITVSGLSEGDTVKFYRVLEYDQTADKTVANAEAATTGKSDWHAAGWKVASPFETGINALTLEEFKAILTNGITDVLAGKIAKNATGTTTITATANEDGEATKSAPGAGLYVAIVTPADPGTMYNPIFVASDYYTTSDGDKSSTWEAVTEPLSYSNEAMAKKSELTVKKEAKEASEATNETNEAKAVGVGDTVDYTVKTTIPEFADNYTAPLFVINDSLSAGLKLKQDTIHVYKATVSGDTWAKGAEITPTSGATTQLTISGKSDTTYKVTFDPDYLLSLDAAQPIIVEYSAEVTETAVTNVNEENNTITIEYSHDPSVVNEGNGKKIRDKTHHYSFTIDGSIWGSSDYRTIETVKVGLDKDGNEITQTKEIANGKTIGALKDAEFKLYIDEECETEYDKGAYKTTTATDAGNKIVSDENGYLKLNGGTGISGLDAGTYWLKEEKAPAGYIKQQAATKIEIIPTYFDEFTFTDADGLEVTTDDVLKSYIVKIDGVQTAEYVLNYDFETGVTAHPMNDVAKENGENMKTTHNDLVIGNAGPIDATHTSAVQAQEEAGKIKNVQGAELPSTGGIGTTIFYLVGAILVIGAGVILVTRRRMRTE